LFWQFIAYAIVQLLKQFYCARKLRHKLPQFIAVCVMDLSQVTVEYMRRLINYTVLKKIIRMLS